MLPKSYVGVLIHGTWGRSSAFAFPDSAFCKTIRSRLQGPITFYRFEWSGKNSHRARLKAGVDLTDYLRMLIENHPDCELYLICHSHAGNVALYALRDEYLKANVSGVITLGAPFICCTGRFYLGFKSDFQTASVGMMAICCGLATALSGFRAWERGGPWTAAFVITLVTLVALFTFFFRIADFGMGDVDLHSWARIHRERALSKFALAEMPAGKLLVISGRGDEALYWLLYITSISDLPFLLASHALKIVFLGWAVMAIGIVPLSLFWRPDDYPAVPDAIAARVMKLVSVFLLTPVICLFFLLVIPWTFSGHSWGFGGFQIAEALVVSLTIRRVPPSTEAIMTGFCRYSLFRSLRHSYICQDVSVQLAIGDWMASRQVPLAEYSRTSSLSFALVPGLTVADHMEIDNSFWGRVERVTERLDVPLIRLMQGRVFGLVGAVALAGGVIITIHHATSLSIAMIIAGLFALYLKLHQWFDRQR